LKIVRVALTHFPAGLFLLGALCLACAGKSSSGTSPGATTAKNTSDAGAPSAAADAGGDERPFAGSSAEATTLISAAVDRRSTDISACVREFRVRRKLAHDKVAVSFGIDQDGRVLGVTSKGKEDAMLKACIQDALKGASFPRSHAGVITVTKTYEDLLQ
jgi:hypothetical protein